MITGLKKDSSVCVCMYVRVAHFDDLLSSLCPHDRPLKLSQRDKLHSETAILHPHHSGASVVIVIIQRCRREYEPLSEPRHRRLRHRKRHLECRAGFLIYIKRNVWRVQEKDGEKIPQDSVSRWLTTQMRHRVRFLQQVIEVSSSCRLTRGNDVPVSAESVTQLSKDLMQIISHSVTVKILKDCWMNGGL